MKFNAFGPSGLTSRAFDKILLIMKLTLVLLITTLVQVSAESYAQRITLSEKSASLENVFRQIKKQSGYNFLYNDQMLKEAKRVEIDVKNAPIDEVLDKCFANQPLTYTITDRTIIVKPAPVSVSQRLTVAGKVTDSKGEPLPGVSVRVKGASAGVTTDTEGNYTISVPDENSILSFSFVGMKSQEVPVSGRRQINVVMEEDAAKLNEVVVVGYGTQKKINLTGAVDQVGSEYFTDRPVSNASHALQGVIPNLNIQISDGKPVRNPAFNIRGKTTIGAGGDASALVLIDGVQGNMIDLNPNDIESVTVLKDAASAAIYGARGAFGVVLIQTKNPGKSAPRINYSGNYSSKSQTARPNWVSDGYLWAKMFNESYLSWTDYVQAPKTVNTFFPFSPAYLDELKYRSEHPGELPDVTIDAATGNYIYYGNTDWLSELYVDNIPAMEHAVNVSGGSEKVDYVFSGRYYKQDGIFKYNTDDFDKYNLRFKGSIQAKSWLRITSNTDLSAFKYKYPLQSINQYDVWTNLKLYGFPMGKLLNPDGTLTQAAANNGVGELYYGRSKSVRNQTFLRNTTGFAATALNKTLNIRGDFTYQNTNNVDERRLAPVTFSAKPGVLTTQGVNNLTNNSAKINYYAANLFGDYTRNFADHQFKVLLGGNAEIYRFRNLEVQRDDLLLEDKPDFNLASGLNYKIAGSSKQWTTLGVFSRLNYVYKDRYMFEANGRLDGASTFPESQQYGFFPSVSAGWNIASENFMSRTRNWLDALKIRVSYGSLGNSTLNTINNDAINPNQYNPYLYQQTVSASRSGIILNGSNPTYFTQPIVLPDDFTWETSTTLNGGIDLTMLKNRLNASFDLYQRRTTDMIVSGRPLPAVFGTDVPRGNYADLTTKGFELSLQWRDKINTTKPITYSVRATLSDNTSVIDRFYNPTGLITNSNGTTAYYEGYRIGDIWGYQADGLFSSQAEIDAVDQSFIVVSTGNKLLPGDLKFRNLDGSKNAAGKSTINRGNNTLENPGDQTIIGNSTPRYTYGFTTNWEWNNISLSAFFQGVGKRDWYPGHESGIFWGQYTRWYGQVPQHTIEGTWTVDNPNPDSYFPRYRGPMTAGGRELGYPVDRYLQNASYIRLKDLTIGYTLPKKFIQRARMSNARVYLSGQNLWTYSPMFKLTRDIDPEVIENSDPEIRSDMGQGAAYPMLKTYTLGLNVTF